jgi:hypothetical protein
MKKCHGFMEEESGGSRKVEGFPGNDFSATSASLRGNAFPGAAMPRRIPLQLNQSPPSKPNGNRHE